MGKIKKFLEPYDWNVLLQEISTFLIVCGVMVVYLSRSFAEVKPLLVVITLVVAIFISIKCMIYSTAVDFNAYKGVRKRQYLYRPDTTDYVHEVCTAVLGAIVGACIAPALLSLFVFDRFWYPNFLGATLILLAVVGLKIFLYSQTRKVTRRSARQGYGGILLIKCLYALPTLIVGFFVGCYIYICGILFIPAEEHPDYYSSRVFEKKTALIGPLGGKSHYLREEYEYRTFSQLWGDEYTGPYLKFAVLLSVLCLLVKVSDFITRSAFITMEKRRTLWSEGSPSGKKPATNKSSLTAGQLLSKAKDILNSVVDSDSASKVAYKPSSRKKSYRTFPTKPLQHNAHQSPGSARPKTGQSKTQEHRMAVADRRRVSDQTTGQRLSATGRHAMAASDKRRISARTQEHKLGETGKYPISARTKEHRLGDHGDIRTKEYKLAPGSPGLPAGWPFWKWEIVTFALGVGIGILAIPLLRNAYFYKRSVYPPLSGLLIIVLCAMALWRIWDMIPDLRRANS